MMRATVDERDENSDIRYEIAKAMVLYWESTNANQLKVITNDQ